MPPPKTPPEVPPPPKGPEAPEEPGPPEAPPTEEPGTPIVPPEPPSEPPSPPPPRPNEPAAFLAERPETILEIPREQLVAHSRRSFVLFGLGALASATTAWWLLPDRTKARLLPGPWRDRLDTLAARVGLSREAREHTLDRALTFDDDVAEALYSRNRQVRTYRTSDATPPRINYNGQIPDPAYVNTWKLRLMGLDSKQVLELTLEELLGRFHSYEQVTRLVCVEGWSAVAWWKGLRFADLVRAFPPALGATWAALRSSVSLDYAGRPDPYYVSIDLRTARHAQTLLATHLGGQWLTVEHGAPLRLVAPMKLGLKNIKAVTEIEYTSYEPPDYWNERGYSKYDGL